MNINYNFLAFLLILGLFLGMLAMFAFGQRLGKRSFTQEKDLIHPRLTGVEAAIFDLIGLMIASTFSGAADLFIAGRICVGQHRDT